MSNFFEDTFHFFTADVPAAAKAAAEESSNAAEDVVHNFFNAWQSAADDFFSQAQTATASWGDPTHDFLDAWQQATDSFADTYASWWGWKHDGSPI